MKTETYLRSLGPNLLAYQGHFFRREGVKQSPATSLSSTAGGWLRLREGDGGGCFLKYMAIADDGITSTGYESGPHIQKNRFTSKSVVSGSLIATLNRKFRNIDKIVLRKTGQNRMVIHSPYGYGTYERVDNLPEGNPATHRKHEIARPQDPRDID